MADPDLSDTATSDIATCFETVTEQGSPVKKPKNALGRTCQLLLAKKKHSVFVSLHSPLENLPSLLPANVELGALRTD